MKSITDLSNLGGKRVLVRVDWNVPVIDGEVVDDFRIRKSLPTLEYLKREGANLVIVTHLTDEKASLRPVYEYVNNFFPMTFETESDVILLENLRHNPGEKSNDQEFARALAARADIYVNEAFPESHRSYASIVGVPEFLPSFAGLQFEMEVRELAKAFNPKKPFLLILGGAKFDTKIPLLKKFISIADRVFVGGALANNFFKEQGVDIDGSLVSEGDFGLKEFFETGKIILPLDTVLENGKIIDAGMETIEKLKPIIASSKFILWNGPLGEYERNGKEGTLALAQAIADSGVEAIVGGGDTTAAIKKLGISDKFSFVSTGGGAMLDFLSSGTLPGIEALKK